MFKTLIDSFVVSHSRSPIVIVGGKVLRGQQQQQQHVRRETYCQQLIQRRNSHTIARTSLAVDPHRKHTLDLSLSSSTTTTTMSRLITVAATADASLPSKPSAANYTTIAIEGNIGSGKTTFLRHLQEFNAQTVRHVEAFAEPINQWRDIRGINLFQLLHEDINRWCFPFQSYVQLSMLAVHQALPTRPEVTIKLMERSLYSARYCFVENLYRRQCMRPEEYAIIDEWFQYLVKNEERVGVDLIIYLKTDPEVAFERIRKRNRVEEKGLTIDYLRDLHDLHEQWLGAGQLSDNKFAVPAPVITIDANQQLDVVKKLYDSHSADIINGTVFRSEPETGSQCV